MVDSDAGVRRGPWHPKEAHEVGPARMTQSEINDLTAADAPASDGACLGCVNGGSTAPAGETDGDGASDRGSCYRWGAWCGCSGLVACEAIEQTWREVRAAPLMTCLGACTVFLVVLVAAVLQTLLARAPLIFLRLAENAEG